MTPHHIACAEIEMTPHHIVMRAAQYGVDAVAITDHNASANAAAAVEAAKNYGVKVFPGMEVECREEAHIVVLFDTLEQLAAWQKIQYERAKKQCRAFWRAVYC